MKKKNLILLAVILAVLLIPVPTAAEEYDATMTFTSLTYKIIHWDVPNYEKTKLDDPAFTDHCAVDDRLRFW